MPEGKLPVLSGMKRQQNATSNKKGEEELDPQQPRDSEAERRKTGDSKGSQSLAVGDVFNKNIKPASPGTFTRSRQRRRPSLLFLLSVYGTRPASGESLPPEAEVHVRDKQEGPRGKCLWRSPNYQQPWQAPHSQQKPACL